MVEKGLQTRWKENRLNKQYFYKRVLKQFLEEKYTDNRDYAGRDEFVSRILTLEFPDWGWFRLRILVAGETHPKDFWTIIHEITVKQIILVHNRIKVCAWLKICSFELNGKFWQSPYGTCMNHVHISAKLVRLWVWVIVTTRLGFAWAAIGISYISQYYTICESIAF